jgi:HSP20 family molecular chaperone IbpA
MDAAGEIEKKVKGNLSGTADLRGAKKEDLKIEISDQAPTVQGERKYEKKEEKEGVYRLQADLEHHRFLQRRGSGWRSSA